MNGTSNGDWAAFRHFWFYLLNQGILRAGTANSDSHSLTENVLGTPRTLVWTDQTMADFDQATFNRAVRAGAMLGTNGPVLDVELVSDGVRHRPGLTPLEPARPPGHPALHRPERSTSCASSSTGRSSAPSRGGSPTPRTLWARRDSSACPSGSRWPACSRRGTPGSSWRQERPYQCRPRLQGCSIPATTMGTARSTGGTSRTSRSPRTGSACPRWGRWRAPSPSDPDNALATTSVRYPTDIRAPSQPLRPRAGRRGLPPEQP